MLDNIKLVEIHKSKKDINWAVDDISSDNLEKELNSLSEEEFNFVLNTTICSLMFSGISDEFITEMENEMKEKYLKNKKGDDDIF